MRDAAAERMLFRTRYRVSRMDCAAEEQLIRTALGPLTQVRRLDFDLQARELTAWHEGEPRPITERLAPLKLASTLIETRQAGEADAARIPAADADLQEARTLRILLGINAAMFLLEMVMGVVAQSTGLMADSLDMLADASVYGLSLYAVGQARERKVQIAHVSGWLQLALALGVLIEVLRRFAFGSEPEPPIMIGISFVALLANVGCLGLISRHRHAGAHMKASWIFSSNDVLANLGVIAAGLLVSWTGSRFPDLIIGTVIAIVVAAGAVRILKLR